jgi:hypothetical protein
MKWVWAIGTASGLLAATTLSAAEPLNEAGIHHESSARSAPSVPQAPVRSAPHSREFSRVDAAYEPELRAELAEPPKWYGWQTLTFDGALLVGSVVGLQLSSQSELAETLVWIPPVAFAVGGPTIHLIHREPWRALGSLGLRAGLPVLGGAFGIGFWSRCPPPEGDYGSCGLGELVVGAAVGVLAASLIDGFSLARESRKAPRDVSLSLAPFISADGTTRELRLRGQF